MSEDRRSLKIFGSLRWIVGVGKSSTKVWSQTSFSLSNLPSSLSLLSAHNQVIGWERVIGFLTHILTRDVHALGTYLQFRDWPRRLCAHCFFRESFYLNRILPSFLVSRDSPAWCSSLWPIGLVPSYDVQIFPGMWLLSGTSLSPLLWGCDVLWCFLLYWTFSAETLLSRFRPSFPDRDRYFNRAKMSVEVLDEAQYKALSAKVADQSAPMARRMRAVFTLRSLGTNEAVDALAPCTTAYHSLLLLAGRFWYPLLCYSLPSHPTWSLAVFFLSLFSLDKEQLISTSLILAHPLVLLALTDPSALLGHEVAYCLGQTRNPHAIPHLVLCIFFVLEDATLVFHDALAQFSKRRLKLSRMIHCIQWCVTRPQRLLVLLEARTPWRSWPSTRTTSFRRYLLIRMFLSPHSYSISSFSASSLPREFHFDYQLLFLFPIYWTRILIPVFLRSAILAKFPWIWSSGRKRIGIKRMRTRKTPFIWASTLRLRLRRPCTFPP